MKLLYYDSDYLTRIAASLNMNKIRVECEWKSDKK